MSAHFPRKTAGWLAMACLLVLVLVLVLSRNGSTDSFAPLEGKSGASGHISPASRSEKTDRDHAAAKPKRSLNEAFGTMETLGEQKLSAGQIDTFVSARNRSVDSLLSAFRLGGDKAYLQEAMERFPDNPQVLLTSLSQEFDAAKRLAILENLKRVDPSNALGNCMAACALFDLGRKDEAFEELKKLTGKPVNDFTVAFAQNDEEAYLYSGFPATKSKMTALFGGTKQTMLQLRGLADSMDELRGSYQSGGDGDSAETVRNLEIGLGQQLQQGAGTLVDELVGMVVEKKALKGLDSEETQARLEEIGQRKESITGNSKRVVALMDDPSVAESDWALYFDRAKLFGEAAANEWMLEKYPAK